MKGLPEKNLRVFYGSDPEREHTSRLLPGNQTVPSLADLELRSERKLRPAERVALPTNPGIDVVLLEHRRVLRVQAARRCAPRSRNLRAARSRAPQFLIPLIANQISWTFSSSSGLRNDNDPKAPADTNVTPIWQD
jgi:hypothetical protein